MKLTREDVNDLKGLGFAAEEYGDAEALQKIELCREILLAVVESDVTSADLTGVACSWAIDFKSTEARNRVARLLAGVALALKGTGR